MMPNNTKTRLITSALALAPFLFAIFAIGQGQSAVAAEYPETELYVELTIVLGLMAVPLFLGANILATFAVNSVHPERKVLTWYLVRQASRESVALFGCVIYFLAATSGQLVHAPWIWLTLFPAGALVFFTISDFPNDDRIVDRARRLGL